MPVKFSSEWSGAVANWQQRVLRTGLPLTATSFAGASARAYFVYLGKTLRAITPKHVEVHINPAGSGAQTAEVGLFSTPSAPDRTAKTFTKLVATGTVDDLTTTGLKRNPTAFTVEIPAGTHLWAGVRTAMATTQPTYLPGIFHDRALGAVQWCTAAAALTGAGPWTGEVQVASNSTLAPDITVTLD